MKLNYKKTIFVGFAFFLITAFWQAYDTIIPKILTDKFGMSQSLSGVIMAADNVLALFMLPLFGTLSDRCKSRRGRRTPFILAGTVCAAALFFFSSMVSPLLPPSRGGCSRLLRSLKSAAASTIKMIADARARVNPRAGKRGRKIKRR